MRAIHAFAMLSLTPLLLPVGSLSAQAPRPPSDSARLQGRYVMVKGFDINGVPATPAFIAGAERVTRGDQVRISLNGQLAYNATVTLHAGKPGLMDYRITEGPYADVSFAGLYEFRGDTVVLVFGAPDAPRPAKIEARAGQTMFFWLPAAQ